MIVVALSPLVVLLFDLHSVKNMEYILSISAFSFNVILIFAFWFVLK